VSQISRRHVALTLIGLLGLVLLAANLPGLSGRVEKHEALRGYIESLQAAEGRFRELVIGLRHGVTSNYDEANAWQQRIVEINRLMAAEVASVPDLAKSFDAYRQAGLGHENHWEDFKQRNSVVRNSFRYIQSDLPVFIHSLHETGKQDDIHESLATLNTALFLQALGAAADRQAEIEQKLAEIRPGIGRQSASAQRGFALLERHVGIILKQVPPLARDMAVLVHGDARARLASLAEANRQQLLAEQERASWYRRGLFLGVVILLLGLALLATRYMDSLRRLGEQGGFLKSLTDTLGVGVLATDHADRVVFANPQVEKLLGYAPGQIIGVSLPQHCVDLSGGHAAEGVCRIALASSQGQAQHGMQHLRRVDGSIVPVEFSSTPLEVTARRGMVTVLQDITRRLQEEKDLRLAGTVFDSSQQGIIITDAEGMIVRVNPAYCRMTGYLAEDLVGKNPRILQSGLHERSFYREMWAELILNGRWQGELMNRRKNGERYIQWANIDAVRTEQGDMLYVGITSDISELVYTRERLAHLAYYDTLTSLPNRVLFQDRLNQALNQARRDKEHFALILADMDNFKTVNDTLGHDAGDDLLVEVARRLKSSVREVDTVARIGGDEFALILMRTQGPEDAAKVAANVVEALSRPYRIQGLEIAGGASLGVTFWPSDGDTPEILLKHADVAMYRAKERGRNNYQFFTSDMADGVVDAMRIESGLRQAIEAGELSMYYQPQVGPDGRAVAAEALMRWNSKELGWVPPSRFIPIAEHTGLIGALGDFALLQACRQCVVWRERLAPDFRIAVNLSAAQFKHEGLVERVADVLHQFNLPGSALELEITESVIMEDVARGQAVLAGLKRLGCKLAIDDFGTGYSSLAYLKRFLVDVLKIDKSFIDGLGEASGDASVAEAIVSLARSLGLDVVAEGVETSVQLEVLRQIAGDDGYLAQGYFYSPPVPVAEFEQRFPAFRQLKLVG
jgi:diguanylate cyclase (GGDEF)-like protein/PAS domain S-box-containing protein